MQAVFFVCFSSSVTRIVEAWQFAFFVLFIFFGCSKNKKDRSISGKAKLADRDGLAKPKVEPNNTNQTGVVSGKKHGAKVAQVAIVEEKVVPKVMPLDKKGEQIAKGVKRKKNEYPTMGDVISDWDEKSDGDEKKAEKNDKKLFDMNSKETKEKSAVQDSQVSKEKKEGETKGTVNESEGNEKEKTKDKSHRSAQELKDKQKAKEKGPKEPVPAKAKELIKPSKEPKADELKEKLDVAVPAAKAGDKVAPIDPPKPENKTSDSKGKSNKIVGLNVASSKEFSFKEGKTQEESPKTSSQLGPSIESATHKDINKKNGSSKKPSVGKADDVKQSDEGDEN